MSETPSFDDTQSLNHEQGATTTPQTPHQQALEAAKVEGDLLAQLPEIWDELSQRLHDIQMEVPTHPWLENDETRKVINQRLQRILDIMLRHKRAKEMIVELIAQNTINRLENGVFTPIHTPSNRPEAKDARPAPLIAVEKEGRMLATLARFYEPLIAKLTIMNTLEVPRHPWLRQNETKKTSIQRALIALLDGLKKLESLHASLVREINERVEQGTRETRTEKTAPLSPQVQLATRIKTTIATTMRTPNFDAIPEELHTRIRISRIIDALRAMQFDRPDEELAKILFGSRDRTLLINNALENAPQHLRNDDLLRQKLDEVGL